MRYMIAIVLMSLISCSNTNVGGSVVDQNPTQSGDLPIDMEGLLWSNSVEFELQLAAALNAFDVGPFIDYDRRFDVSELPENILSYIDSLAISEAPDEFPLCGAVLNPQTYIVRIKGSDNKERTYMDEINCNVGAIGGLPMPEEIIGILEQGELHILRSMLLDFDPRTLNP